MPKASKMNDDLAAARHDPLGEQIAKDRQTTVVPRTKKQRKREWERQQEREQRGGAGWQDDEEDEMRGAAGTIISERMSRKILETAAVQRRSEEQRERRAQGGGAAGGAASAAAAAAAQRAAASTGSAFAAAAAGFDLGNGEETFEEDEFVRISSNGEFVEEVEVDADDEAALAAFMPSAAPERRTLADIIFEKMKEKEEADRRKREGIEEEEEDAFSSIPGMNPKVENVYKEIGKFLKRYRAGKIPKAFKVIPQLRNWEEVLCITEPEEWSPHAMYYATRLFASNLKPKMAQRFYNLVLLPAVQVGAK